jgi:SAM-dependent methyltransferase
LSVSLIYRSAVGYELLMRALYGRHYADRMRAIATEVPPGSSVLELCCGPATLYRRFLHGRTSRYLGVDVNPGFVAALRRRGVDALQLDLAAEDRPLPSADVVIIQASLYHFLPRAERVVDRMLAAARDRVIVSEPVRNLASSDVAIVRIVGRRASDPGTGGHARRFDDRSLDAFMARYRGQILKTFAIPGGRERVYVLEASRCGPDRRSGTAVGS